MQRGRHIGTAFWLVLLLIWVPWTIWYAISTYAIGNEDMKFGRDGGLIFSSLMYAYIAVTSSLSAAVVRFLDSSLFQPIAVRKACVASIGAVLSLSVLSPVVFRLDVPWLGEVTGIIVGWAAISTTVCVVWFAAVRAIAAQPGAAGDAR